MNPSTATKSPESSVTQVLSQAFGIGKKVFKWYEENSEAVDYVAGGIRDFVREKILRPDLPAPDPVNHAELKQFAFNKRVDAREKAIIRELTDAEAHELQIAHNVDLVSDRLTREQTHLAGLDTQLRTYRRANAQLMDKLVRGEGVLEEDERLMLERLRLLTAKINGILMRNQDFVSNAHKHELIEGAHNITRDLINSIPAIGAFINAGIDMGRTAFKVLDSPTHHDASEIIRDVYIDGSHSVAHRVVNEVASVWLDRKRQSTQAMESDDAQPEFAIEEYDTEKTIMRAVEDELSGLIATHRSCLSELEVGSSCSRIPLRLPALYCYTPLLSYGEVFLLVLAYKVVDYQYVVLAIDLPEEYSAFAQYQAAPGLSMLDAINRSYMRLKTRAKSRNQDRPIFQHPLSCVGHIMTITHIDRIVANMRYVNAHLTQSLVGTIADCRRSILERVLWGVMRP